MDIYSLRGLVECPICYEVRADTPVFMCVNGHHVCGACKAEMAGDRCPQGNCAFLKPPTRNRAIERLIASGDFIEDNCKYQSSGCSFRSLRSLVSAHESACEMRPVTCANADCGETVTARQMEKHAEACDAKTISCGNAGCNVSLRPSAMASHSSLCSFRPIACSNAGCGEAVALARLASHVSQCPFGLVACVNGQCSVKVRAAEADAHRIECTFRFVQCSNRGCSQTCRARDLSRHLSQECSRRLVPCPLSASCAAVVQASELARHSQTCAFRRVGCQRCGNDDLTAGQMSEHEAECAARSVHCPCHECSENVAANEIESHVRTRHPSVPWRSMSRSDDESHVFGASVTNNSTTSTGHSEWHEVHGLKYDDGVFFACAASTSDSHFYAWMVMAAGKKEAQRFRCQIHLRGARSKLLFHSDVFSVDSAKEEVWAESRCLQISDRMLAQLCADLEQDGGVNMKMKLKIKGRRE